MTEEPIELKLAGHTFRFTRRTWGEDVQFAIEHPESTRTDYTAFGLSSVDGSSVDYSRACILLQALPKPIRDRVVFYYMGSLPNRRKFTVDIPFEAPPVRAYMRRVEEEKAKAVSDDDDLLNRTFGEEEVREAGDLALRMAKAANFVGATKAHEPQTSASFRKNEEDFDEGPVNYHAVVTE